MGEGRPEGAQQTTPKSRPCYQVRTALFEPLPQLLGEILLQRHGGRFATHPVFCFLIFNVLLRSSNRRISMVRTTKRSFARVEEVYRNLTADRLRRAEDEMRETRADPDISFLLRELSIFGHAQPLSNETRLLMRRKIQSLCIWTGAPAI